MGGGKAKDTCTGPHESCCPAPGEGVLLRLNEHGLARPRKREKSRLPSGSVVNKQIQQLGSLRLLLKHVHIVGLQHERSAYQRQISTLSVHCLWAWRTDAYRMPYPKYGIGYNAWKRYTTV